MRPVAIYSIRRMTRCFLLSGENCGVVRQPSVDVEGYRADAPQETHSGWVVSTPLPVNGDSVLLVQLCNLFSTAYGEIITAML
jgi:hypothetical protein